MSYKCIYMCRARHLPEGVLSHSCKLHFLVLWGMGWSSHWALSISSSISAFVLTHLMRRCCTPPPHSTEHCKNTAPLISKPPWLTVELSVWVKFASLNLYKRRERGRKGEGESERDHQKPERQNSYVSHVLCLRHVVCGVVMIILISDSK